MNVGPEPVEQTGNRFKAVGEGDKIAGEALKPHLDAQQPEVARLPQQPADGLDLVLDLDLAAIDRGPGVGAQEALGKTAADRKDVVQVCVVPDLVEVGSAGSASETGSSSQS
jgi:hypothetical protein